MVNMKEQQLDYLRKSIRVEYPSPQRPDDSNSTTSIIAFISEHIGARNNASYLRDLEVRFFRGMLSFEDLCYIVGADLVKCQLYDFRYFESGRKLNSKVVITQFVYKAY